MAGGVVWVVNRRTEVEGVSLDGLERPGGEVVGSASTTGLHGCISKKLSTSVG